MSSSNWFPLYSSALRRPHPDFGDDPFTRREAWIDLLANKTRTGGRWLHTETKGAVWLEEGQVLGAQRFVGPRWGWSRSKVDRFFSWLVDEVGNLEFVKDTKAGRVYAFVNHRLYPAGGPRASQTNDRTGNDLRQNRPKTEPDRRAGLTEGPGTTYGDIGEKPSRMRAGPEPDASQRETKRRLDVTDSTGLEKKADEPAAAEALRKYLNGAGDVVDEIARQVGSAYWTISIWGNTKPSSYGLPQYVLTSVEEEDRPAVLGAALEVVASQLDGRRKIDSVWFRRILEREVANYHATENFDPTHIQAERPFDPERWANEEGAT